MAKILIAGRIPEQALNILKDADLDIDVFDDSGALITKDELIKRVADKDFLITPLSTQVDKDVINSAPNLKLIANYGAGFNNIDTDYAKSKGIPVTSTPKVSTTSTAEVTCGLMISLAHRIVEGDKLMREEGFSGWAPLFFLDHQLAGKTLGIIGMGQIGQAVAKRMHAFDMNILYSQRKQLDPTVEAQLGAKFARVDEVIENADVLTLHVPATPATHHMIGAEQFRAMKDSAMLINASRGPVIDEGALYEALLNHDIAGAALDVYEHEPKVDDGFKSLKNVILTPHIGNATVEARDAMAEIVAKNTVAMNKGEKPDYIVNDVTL
ncbi:2-hydroxyacid dehydrogenase family protein [Lentilactobacillus sp. G22-6]|uniref:2-hydroxyacid dehydrogenase family protein n=1 Tax=Lentilactobacillus dabitei TaxID=2831523 RepID=UPI001C26F21F|nr:2-hydroxyacid dehydrogenase family protein [Lentilactobacillus dabitei]MBU9789734.1 2-hydroxyacid dehydrogenase family protein [Lentilactobacillus dabitei]